MTNKTHLSGKGMTTSYFCLSESVMYYHILERIFTCVTRKKYITKEMIQAEENFIKVIELKFKMKS